MNPPLPLPDLLPRGVPAWTGFFSNLTLSFFTFPPATRRHMRIFYAFCKTVDDIADSSALSAEDKHMHLSRWRSALENPECLPRDLREVFEAHQIGPELPLQILEGVTSDVDPQRFEDFPALASYCEKVAVAVGLVANKITGAHSDQANEYAYFLGMALQLTNILRDVAEDLQMGRLYLPCEDLRRFEVTEKLLRSGQHNQNTVSLFAFQAKRAREFFQRVRLPDSPEERQALRAAEIMRAVYARILQKMENDNFRLLSVRYRLGLGEKLRFLLLSRVIST